MSLKPGQSLRHYRLIEPLGSGGMGIVWRARDTNLHRDVAIKMLHAVTRSDPTRHQQFKREAKAAAAISHPHIASVYEIGEADGITFIVMELVGGTTLSSLIRDDLPPISRAVEIAIEIADGLTYAHLAGIVHRDLKPDNVMIGNDGHARVLDFGLAKLTDPRTDSDRARSQAMTISEEMTLEGRVIGTAAYMSPEQARGRPVDSRTDVFSFGALLYEMVTGRRPFGAESPADSLSRVLGVDPEAPSSINSDVPLELDRIVRKCLQKDPDGRYHDTRDLLVDLRQLKRDTDSQPLRQGPESTLASNRRRGVRRGLAVGGLIVIAVLLALTIRMVVRDTPVTTTTPTTTAADLRLLTANSRDQPVRYALISPDGTYLAYHIGDSQATVTLLDTGETVPIELVGVNDMRMLGWFPDSQRLLVSGTHEDDPDPSIWVYSIFTKDLRRLRRDATGTYIPGGAVSPDGETVAFVPTSSGRSEVWLMNVDGTDDRRLVRADDDDGMVHWWISFSPDSRRVLYRNQRRQADGYFNSIESRDVRGGDVTEILPPTLHVYPGIHGVWMPDGRVVFSRSEERRLAAKNNLWIVDVDTATGLPTSTPARVTDWVDYFSFSITSTRDSELSLVRWRTDRDCFLAKLDPDRAVIEHRQQIAAGSSDERPGGWLDGESAMLLYSDRRGTGDIYRFDLAGERLEPLISSGFEESAVQLADGGRHIIYMKSDTGRDTAEIDEAVLIKAELDGTAQTELGRFQTDDQIDCGTLKGAPCFVFSVRNVTGRRATGNVAVGSVSVTRIDPATGSTVDLGEYELEPDSLNVSNDGAQVAWLESSTTGDTRRLRVTDLDSRSVRNIDLPDWTITGPPAWGSGDKIYIGAMRDDKRSLLRVDGRGEVTAFRIEGPPEIGTSALLPSPSERLFAYSAAKRESAVWLLSGL